MSLAYRGVLPLRQLKRLQRRAATNVLVVHGTKAGRDRMARGFHSARPAPAGSYYSFDCLQEEDRLRSEIRAWIARDGWTSEPAAFLGDGRGTLFVDAVEALSEESQRLLLVLLERLAEATASGHCGPIGRLIAGSSTDLESEVGAGRFLPHLYDALNKARVDLRGTRAGEPPGGR